MSYVFRNIVPRLTTKELLLRAEARARRDRWIAVCVLVGTLVAFVALVVGIGRGL